MKKTSGAHLVLFYFLVGLVYLFLWIFFDSINYPEPFHIRAVNNAWRALYVITLCFVLFEFSLPFIMRRRKTVLLNILIAVPLLFILLMLLSWGLYAWRSFGISLHIYTPLKVFGSDEHGVTEQLSYSLMTVIVFGITRHIYNYVKLSRAAQQLKIEKQEAELNYLKSQTNPHFLFNTLNNIYSLARDKSDLAPESILRLSEILRFILYETGGEYIAIEQEINIINNYIDLEKLRYDDTLKVNFECDIEDQKQALPPLLLIPLVENAFKHGVSETRNDPFIDILLSVNKKQLKFIVKNSSEQSPGNEAVKENIGLSNLRRQLELLYKDYNLSLHREGSVFSAELKINLASHA